jgi:transposase-like protein
LSIRNVSKGIETARRSTRSLDRLVRAMGATAVSKSQVSRMCEEFDERVKLCLMSIGVELCPPIGVQN